MGRTGKPSNDPKMPAGIEIRQLKSGSRLRIFFQYRGVKCRETLKLDATPKNIKYAERLRGEILNAIALNTFDYIKYFPNSKRAKIFGHVNSNVTVGKLLQTFLSQCEKTVEHSTLIGYRRVSNAHLFPAFGHIKVNELKTAVIRDWIKELNLTTKTVKNILVPLRHVLEQAIVDEIINKNPLDNIILSKLLNKNTSKSSFKAEPFDKTEIRAILDNATGQEKNLYQFAFFSGLRTSELIALEWSDIDFENRIISVSKASVHKRVKSTKTHSGKRDVVMLPLAYESLIDQKKYTFSYGRRVFHNPKTNAAWEDSQQILKGSWKPLLNRAKVKYRNQYQTRHTYASLLLSKGENIMWVARQMGHVDIEMVIKNYGQWIPDKNLASGYKFVYDWGAYLEDNK